MDSGGKSDVSRKKITRDAEYRGFAERLGRTGERETYVMVAWILITVKVSVLLFNHSN